MTVIHFRDKILDHHVEQVAKAIVYNDQRKLVQLGKDFTRLAKTYDPKGKRVVKKLKNNGVDVILKCPNGKERRTGKV